MKSRVLAKPFDAAMFMAGALAGCPSKDMGEAGTGLDERPGTRFQEATGLTTWHRLLFCGLVAVAAALGFVVASPPVGATDLHYTLLSPSFGGTDTVPYQMEQAQDALIAGKKAATAAAAAAAAQSVVAANPYAPLINAITSQLTALVAYNIASEIANAKPGAAGTIQSGNVSITYVNSDGEISVTITSPTGSTTLVIPSGS